MNAVFAERGDPVPVVYLYGEPSLGNPLIELSIKNQKKLLLIDTGAAKLSLSMKSDFLEKNARKTEQKHRFQNLDGEISESSLWELPEIEIGNTKIKNVLASPDGAEGISIGKAPEEAETLQGIVGLQLFKGKKVVIDFRRNTFSFVDAFEGKICEEYWYSFDDEFRFELALEGKKYRAVIDTGSNVSFANAKQRDFMKLRSSARYEDFSGSKLYYFHPFGFDASFKPSEIDWKIFLYDLSHADVDIIIGMDVLLGKNLLIDMVNRRFCLLAG